MIFILYTVHVLICLFLIAVVLLQQGKGADLSVFGGGGTQTAFGARGAATVLHKLTVASFVGFILTTLAIGIYQGERSESEVIDTLPSAEEVAADEADEAPAEQAGALPIEVEDDAASEQTGGDAPATAPEDPAGDGDDTEAEDAPGEGASSDDGA